MPVYTEYKTSEQSNINWGETFKMGVKAPLVADRIFDTYNDADNYVKDPNSSAVAGILITVINDPDPTKNGMYYVNENASYGFLEVYKHDPGQITIRTINHEDLSGDMGNININDGYYFPNAVQDWDENWYGAVVIGEQVWMAENLMVSKFKDGTAILDGSGHTSSSTPYLYNNSLSQIPERKRGFLYNFASTMGTIAPDGWKVPEKSDVDTLLSYLKKQKRFIVENNSEYVAKSIASPYFWIYSTGIGYVGDNASENDYAGLCLFPTGLYDESNVFIEEGEYSDIWTTTDIGEEGKAYFVRLWNSSAEVAMWQGLKICGRAIRCICNMKPEEFRVWYVNEYGCMQHNVSSESVSSDYGEYTIS